MNWAQRNDVTPEESRRLFNEHRWVIMGSLGVFIVAVLLIPVPLLLIADAPVGLVTAGGLLFMFAFGVGSWWWMTRQLNALRSKNPPFEGGPSGGERPGG